jgi:hypothetical protein
MQLTAGFVDLGLEAADQRAGVLSVCNRSREIYALGGINCSSTFVTAGFDWPTAIDLVYSTYTPHGEEPVNFATDEAMQTINQKLRDQAKSGGEVWVTVIGQLRVRKQYVLGRGGDGKLHGNGYGHLSLYPAQLVIKTVRDLTVRPALH